MTLKEKRIRIGRYCSSIQGCESCVLKKWCDEKKNAKHYFFDMPEDMADNAITILDSTGADLGMFTEDLSAENVTKLSVSKEAVNHPDHYQGPHECIEIMEAMFGKEAVKNFCRCNAFKYRFRAGMKNGEEDIRKAEWYEEYLIKMGGIDNDTK